MTKGYVYILTNKAMPGLVKIGKTTRDPSRRAIELHQTGVPFPFVVEFSLFAPDCHDLEGYVHRSLADFRVSDDREFFRCEPSLAAGVLEVCHREQVDMWLDEFLPDHLPVQCEEIVDMGAAAKIAADHDLHPFEMVQVYGLLTADEVSGAVGRLMAQRAVRRSEILARRMNGGAAG